VPKSHALCKDEEHNARLFSTPLIWALCVRLLPRRLRESYFRMGLLR
jgi:hypothetical protein